MQGCPARCLYCHNPDSWNVNAGKPIEVEEIVHWAVRGIPYYGNTGGVTFSGGEPLMQGEFLLEAMRALKKEGIKTAIDTSGTYYDEYTDEVIKQCDLVLLDIKHPDPERFEIITGRSQETLFPLIDMINKYKRHVWIRNVVVQISMIPRKILRHLMSLLKKSTTLIRWNCLDITLWRSKSMVSWELFIG